MASFAAREPLVTRRLGDSGDLQASANDSSRKNAPTIVARTSAVSFVLLAMTQALLFDHTRPTP